MAEYSIGEAIKKMLQESHWKQRYLATKLKQDWEELMGTTVAKHTKGLDLQNGILTIFTDVAPLKHELSYNKNLLIAKLNQHLGETVVKEVVVR